MWYLGALKDYLRGNLFLTDNKKMDYRNYWLRILITYP